MARDPQLAVRTQVKIAVTSSWGHNLVAVVITRSEAPSVVERWYVLIVMCLVYAINIAARYVVTTVFEPIRLELHLTDAGAAFLTGVPLALFYVVFGIPIAWLADRSNRRNIVAAALIIWSGFTVFCGLSQTYWQLLVGRVGVGVGEAGGTPPSTSIVSDYFPPNGARWRCRCWRWARRSGHGWALTWPVPSPRRSAGARLFSHSGRPACSWVRSSS